MRGRLSRVDLGPNTAISSLGTDRFSELSFWGTIASDGRASFRPWRNPGPSATHRGRSRRLVEQGHPPGAGPRGLVEPGLPLPDMTGTWDRIARWRDQKMGSRGDLWHRALIDPSVRRLMGPVRGLRILEVACGNGYLARSLAAHGPASVVGIDRSRASIRLARAREQADPSGARFEVGEAGHLQFESGSFDLVVANMALMDIRDVERAIREVARVLSPAGRFVFSIAHPCFDLDDRSAWSVERGFGSDGIYRDTVYRKVRGYREERRSLVPWRIGPRSVVWTESYHRTLSTYGRYLYRAGLAIARVEEPSPLPEMISGSPQGRYLREIPLHLVVEAIRRERARAAWRRQGRSRRGDAPRSGSHGRTSRSGSSRRGSRTG